MKPKPNQVILVTDDLHLADDLDNFTDDLDLTDDLDSVQEYSENQKEKNIPLNMNCLWPLNLNEFSFTFNYVQKTVIFIQTVHNS